MQSTQQNITRPTNNVLNLHDLRPSPYVNTVMSSFVESVISGSEDDLLAVDTHTQESIRNISATAENELEKYWANKISTAKNPHAVLDTFPYIDNYKELIRREVKLLEDAGLSLQSSSNVLIVGSGPLPMTALEMHMQHGICADHVDSSNQAITLCEQLSTALNVNCDYHYATGQSIKLNKKYELILIAALAGNNLEEKQAIIDNLLPSLLDNGRIIVRSAKGIRQLLYPAIEAKSFSHVRLLKEYHPNDYIINSVLVYGR